MIRRYWDSCAFLGWLKGEEDKRAECQSVLEEAVSGKIEIVTSTLTLAEVLWVKKPPPAQKIAKEDRGKVRAVFESEWLVLYELDRRIAERAQDVVWDHDVQPKDAVHVATALSAEVDQLETFDGGLLDRSGQIEGLKISRPMVDGKFQFS